MSDVDMPVGSRVRSNTCDADITPERLADCVRVINHEGISVNSRTTGLVPGVLLTSGKAEEVESEPESEGKRERSGCTYSFAMRLDSKCTWRGERCLFVRGDDGAQCPGVYLVGPYATLRVRVSSATSSSTKVSPFGAVRGRKAARSSARPGRTACATSVTVNSSPESPVAVGELVHVAFSISASKLRFFLNGVLQKEMDVPASELLRAGGDLSVGHNSRCEGAPATISDFFVHSRCLSDEEIVDVYKRSTQSR